VVALEDERSGEDAVEADDRVEASAPAEAIEIEERDDAGDPAEPEVAAVSTAGPVDEAKPEDEADFRPEEPVPAAVTEALPAAAPIAAAARTAAAAAAGGGAGTGHRVSWLSTITGGGRRPSWKITTAAGAAAVIVITLVIVAVSPSAASGHKTGHKAASPKKADPVHVISVTPGNGATGVNGTSSIAVTYSGPVTAQTPLPTLSPSIAGSWQVFGDEATFIPQVGYTEDTHVTVNVPPPAGAATTAATSFSFTTGQYSVLRLEQLLSQLGYLPLSWTPANTYGEIAATDTGAQLAAAYTPPSGTFNFDSGYPSALTSQWSVGTNNEIIDGAVRTFEYDQGLNMDGDAGRQVWTHLFAAIAKDQQNQHGYTYVYVSQAGTETLDLYHNGQLAISSPVNTGIAASPTDDGTFPVYLRYTVTQMQGNNPDGTPYDDTVYWVSYFNGGDAVHAFPRGGYGWYQSLGCVELPSYGSVAQNVWNLITYGTLVTVTGPVA
jgi:hypothetical protein